MRAAAASLCLILISLTACERPAEHSHDEARTAQITVWDDRFEIFAEHRAPVAGTATTFITHVTDLKSLEPRREGPAVFVLKSGPDAAPLEYVEPAPARAGIYTPALTFPRPGAWEVSIGLDGHMVRLPAVAVYASAAEAGKAAPPSAPEGVSFLKEQQWKVQMKAEVVGRRRLVDRVSVPATVVARPGSRASVVSPIAGRLLTNETMPVLGQRVEAGQVLAYVQPPLSDMAARIVEAEAGTVSAKLAQDQAQLAFDRIQRLAAENARSKRELEEAEFTLRSAKAAHEAALVLKAAYGKSGAVMMGDVPTIALRAPIAGTIVIVEATVGEHVATDRTVFSILDASTVHIEGRVPQADAERIPVTPAALLGEMRLDRPVYVAPEIEPVSRTLAIVYAADNAEGRLRPGTAVTLHLETARAEETPAIPAEAVVEEDARPIAFVQMSGETFEKRDLKLGIRDGDWVQVLAGLRAGERVVSKEAFAIRLASVSSVIPAHGHSH